MGYKNKLNQNIISKNKISKLERHQNLNEQLHLHVDEDLIIKNYFNLIENRMLICYLYGENSIMYMRHDRYSCSRPEKTFYAYFGQHLGFNGDIDELIDMLSAYYFGEADMPSLNLKLEDFISCDLNRLNREQIGYIFYTIVNKIHRSGFEVENNFYPHKVNRKLMKDTLISNHFFINKYNELKRIYVVDSILN